MKTINHIIRHLHIPVCTIKICRTSKCSIILYRHSSHKGSVMPVSGDIFNNSSVYCIKIIMHNRYGLLFRCLRIIGHNCRNPDCVRITCRTVVVSRSLFTDTVPLADICIRHNRYFLFSSGSRHYHPVSCPQNALILEVHFFFRLNRLICLRLQHACCAYNGNV